MILLCVESAIAKFRLQNELVLVIQDLLSYVCYDRYMAIFVVVISRERYKQSTFVVVMMDDVNMRKVH